MPTYPIATPGAVKKLRRYWKDRLTPRNPASIVRELKGESDRAMVILVGAVIDDMLTHVLARGMIFMPNDKQLESIFRPDGPFGTFSAKIELSYLFGFIDNTTREQVDTIRELRNACAHSHQEISFSNAALASVAKRLFQPRGVITQPGDTAIEIREAFLQEFVFIVRILGAGSRERGISLVKDDLQKTFFSEPSPSRDEPPQQ
jgi:hypothetical protein